MTTIYDVAKRAGVSVATVSKVLNGYPDVSQKTREKVQRITDELGYHANAVARSLVTRRSMTIGVFFQDHDNQGFRHPFLHDVIASFKDVVGEAGYDLLFLSEHRTDSSSRSFEARAKQRDVDGLFLLGVPRTNPGLAALSRSQIPTVSVVLDLFGPKASYLCSDNVGGAREAVEYLVANGHRKIAFIGDRFGTKPGHDRMLGYQQALQANALQYRSEWVLEGDFSEASGARAMKRLLKCSELPTAVFCASDMMAIGGMDALSDTGLQVARDISIVGFDDIDLAHYVKPGLTTIRQNTDKMGQRAATELLELMNMANKPPSVITVETSLVIRGTVRNIA
ncbi:LacI family transcriptional regulator [Alicyclobacillus fastidiosus]|uniref:LacI family transcriptional regulator n=1 Tax=Alicyclobacillus fastidiosus TaxID=392011 RepID=A0ABY6ZIA7_9BACL|nr:LacI family DNA-binding transcriptional regulator [Alicyclobacillus fastidiosus]WAH42609.1 LacI family transcriptional regulator [Alicyclobacillus fastidiosus]GMA64477.1 LacI family transcriptional regulator [Alicyclobacillus fastidiosus]